VTACEPGGDIALAAARTTVLDFLRRAERPFERTAYDPGHLTASAIVVPPGAAGCLLVWHRRLGRWLQPGGHIDPPDRDAAHAARREAVEETGVQLLDSDGAPVLVGVDVHTIPAAGTEPRHRHFDLCFLFVAADTRIRAAAENPRVRWCGWTDLPQIAADTALLRHAARARRYLTAPGIAPVSPRN